IESVGFDLYPARALRARDSMHDGVLDQRLQQELRNECLVDFRRYSPADLEAFAKPQLLQVQIRLQKVELFPDTDQIGGPAVEGRPQKLGEGKQHRLGSLLIRVDQRRKTLQRVEEKVRMQLSAKRLQLALREALAQFKALNLLSLTEYEVGIGVGTDNYAQ